MIRLGFPLGGQVFTMVDTIEIGGRRIGPGEPAYLVAEMSGNHGSDYERAEEIIRAAKRAGADAIKLQTYTADTLTIDCERDEFCIKGGPWRGRKLYELYREAATPWEWHPGLLSLANDLGLHAFSSPFDVSSVEFLEPLNVPAYKIASFEILDPELLRCVARTRKPVILSTGMSTLSEIEEAVRILREGGCEQLALLRCTSAYPAGLSSMNLRSIPHLGRTFHVPAGLSDHSLGMVAPVVAVALGAAIIEKHLTLSRSEPGPDAAFSMEPQEFASMVDAVRAAESSLGSIAFGATREEQSSRSFRRSLFVVRSMQAGERFSRENVRSIRPGDGMPPRYLDTILGRTAARMIERGTPLCWDLVS